jgi:hypothetical protein
MTRAQFFLTIGTALGTALGIRKVKTSPRPTKLLTRFLSDDGKVMATLDTNKVRKGVTSKIFIGKEGPYETWWSDVLNVDIQECHDSLAGDVRKHLIEKGRYYGTIHEVC